MPRRSGPKRKVYVDPSLSTNLAYGFSTNVPVSDGTALGHKPVDGTTTALVMFGVNKPKPGIATKKDATGSVSSFYDITNKDALIAAKWKVRPGSMRRGRKTRFATPVFVTLTGGIKYAWMMPDALRALIGGDLTALGIQVADGTEKDLVWGANNNKPPRAQKLLPATGSDPENSISTFFDPSQSASLPTGWGALATKEQDN